MIRMTGRFNDGIFQLPFRRPQNLNQSAMQARDPRKAANSTTTAEIVHRRFHAGRGRTKSTLAQLPSMSGVPVDLEQVGECHVCLEANAMQTFCDCRGINA